MTKKNGEEEIEICGMGKKLYLCKTNVDRFVMIATTRKNAKTSILATIFFKSFHC